VKPEEGRFLEFAARACGARLAVEIGTLGGYSGIWIARGLAPGGRLITLEASEAHAAVARGAFERAGVADRVEVVVGDAHATLRSITPRGPFDLCFIDAEKTGYPDYLEWALANVRTGGVIAAHNAFKGGALLDPSARDADTDAVRAVNERFARHPRLVATIFPAGDGTVVGVVVG
jgi:caffeoyl-CoA O-methyltransferase